jgi:hypothetical protein
MRESVRKHYKRLAQFVALANLGCAEILRHNDFPYLHQLKPETEHRPLLRRINRAVSSRFRALRPQTDVPPLFFSDWLSCSSEVRQQLYAYALVRRVFDSLWFLTEGMGGSKSGGQFMQVWLEIKALKDGSMVRVRDPYEDFLAALSDSDLRRLRACPVCRRFFVAWRKDQKACDARCANRLRVAKFRTKQPQYSANRKFRKRTQLSALRQGRHRLMGLHQALAETREPQKPEELGELLGDVKVARFQLYTSTKYYKLY